MTSKAQVTMLSRVKAQRLQHCFLKLLLGILKHIFPSFVTTAFF